MAMDIPKTMTAVVLERYGGLEGLTTASLPVPKPGPGEVLVKVAASPINPSDLSFLQGNYGIKKALPVVPGLEGSGTVVAVGSGMMGRYLMGRRVACIAPTDGNGLWADYVLTGSSLALPLNSEVDLEHGAMSVVNPLTAVAFLSLLQEGNHKVFVQTAAASALGQMVQRLATTAGITAINVVRREDQVSLLRGQGADIVLNSSDADFDGRLAALCREKGASLAFDAVGGTLSRRILTALPQGGKLIVFGGLSEEDVQISIGDLIFEKKSVEGFWLTNWIAQKNMLKLLSLWRLAQKLITDELRTAVRVRYPLEEVQTAVALYRKQMTGGKVLLVPGGSEQ